MEFHKNLPLFWSFMEVPRNLTFLTVSRITFLDNIWDISQAIMVFLPTFPRNTEFYMDFKTITRLSDNPLLTKSEKVSENWKMSNFLFILKTVIALRTWCFERNYSHCYSSICTSIITLTLSFVFSFTLLQYTRITNILSDVSVNRNIPYGAYMFQNQHIPR